MLTKPNHFLPLVAWDPSLEIAQTTEETTTETTEEILTITTTQKKREICIMLKAQVGEVVATYAQDPPIPRVRSPIHGNLDTNVDTEITNAP